MKKNLYYRSVFRRRNIIKEAIYDFFFAACSIPRLVLEVFVRKNFGERYFSFSTAMIITFILALIPIISSVGLNEILSRLGGRAGQFTIFDFLLHYLTWYLFLAGFVAMCIDRRHEIKHLPSVFDFGRYSLSTGHIHQGFLNYQPFGKPLSVRQIETMVEPGFFLVIGLGLWILQQSIGVIIVLSSIAYAISYLGAYYRGDNFIMDNIDEMICNEELTSAFIDGLGPAETRGVNYYGRKPIDPEARRKLANNFIEDEDIVVAM
jgi:hypothetical protein